MKKLPFIIAKLLAKEISVEKLQKTGESMWNVRVLSEHLKQLNDFEKISSAEIYSAGGEHLKIARMFIQHNCLNGEDINWGSNDFLKFRDLTVKDIELLACDIAAATIQRLFENFTEEKIEVVCSLYEVQNVET